MHREALRVCLCCSLHARACHYCMCVCVYNAPSHAHKKEVTLCQDMKKLLWTISMNSDIQQQVPAPHCREDDYTIQQQGL